MDKRVDRNKRAFQGVMILGLIVVGTGLLVTCALNDFDGMRGLAGVACFWVAGRAMSVGW